MGGTAVLTFSPDETPRRIARWLHRQIAAKSPEHAAMVAAYYEGRRLPESMLPPEPQAGRRERRPSC